MKILVTGCLHGGWEELIDVANDIIGQGDKIDAILITGDAQTMRTEEDLESFSAPPKYRLMGTFYKIYTGEIKLPCITIMIGGNHEASDFLFQLPFGGWIAENLFYIGRASALKLGNIDISGISGLYKVEDFFSPVTETFPIRNPNEIHTCYHYRAFSEFQLLGLQSTSIFMSHDWPSSIPSKYGGHYLQKRRPDLVREDKRNNFGMANGMKLIERLKPDIYLASHHHITFKANIENTQFIALPKQTRPDWFIVVDIDGEVGELKYRGEWLSILNATREEMANPEILQKVDWDERWEAKRPTMVHFDDMPVEPFTTDPVQYTIGFCKHYNVYCPNPEIRKQMSSQ